VIHDIGLVQQQLDEINRLFDAKGLLPDDVPELFEQQQRLRLAIARGESPHEELGRLRQQIETYAIDRAFIDRKLQRMNNLLQQRPLPPQRQIEVQRRIQAALSFGVTEHYGQANQELNAIHRLAMP
jgi:nucleotidyltransferase/DNA polymerase involved in DNA repair